MNIPKGYMLKIKTFYYDENYEQILAGLTEQEVKFYYEFVTFISKTIEWDEPLDSEMIESECEDLKTKYSVQHLGNCRDIIGDMMGVSLTKEPNGLDEITAFYVPEEIIDVTKLLENTL